MKQVSCRSCRVIEWSLLRTMRPQDTYYAAWSIHPVYSYQLGDLDGKDVGDRTSLCIADVKLNYYIADINIDLKH